MSHENYEPFDYSTRIVSPQETLYEPTGEEEITIDIVNDTTLAYEEQRTTLYPDTLAINGLLLLRHEGWVRHADIKDAIGFRLSSVALNTRLHKLSDSIEEITGFPDAIEAQGNAQSRVLRLSPYLNFNDIRASFDGNGVTHEWYDESGLPRTMFATTEHRRRALGSLFRDYTDHAQVALQTARLQHENLYKSKDEIELSTNDIHALLAYIEYGLHAYLHDGDEEAKVMATNAYYALLTSMTPMVTGLAKSKWTNSEELIQEGLACGAEVIMDLSGNQNLRQAAESLYPVSMSFINFKYSNYITREVAAKRSMSIKTLRLELLIQEVEKRFAQEHARLPTELEVHAELDDPDISLNRVSSTIRRMQFGYRGMSHYDQYKHVDRATVLAAAIEDQIERIYREDIAAKVFASKYLTDKEKVILSLYYGIFIEGLQGAEVQKTKRGPIFTYPYDRETFEALCQETVGNQRNLGALLDYSYRGIGKILEAARIQAHADLEEIVGDDTAF